MKTKYGLWSLIFGILSVVGIVLQFPPVLAVVFAVLYKVKGDPKDEKQHRYARIGAVLGSLTLGMVFSAWFMVLFPGESGLHGFLMVLIFCATLVLCLWLYERNWNKTGAKAKPAPVQTEPAPEVKLAPEVRPVSEEKPVPNAKPVAEVKPSSENKPSPVSKAPQKTSPKPEPVPSSGKVTYTLSPLCQPTHSGEVEHGFYLVREHGKWNIEHHAAFAKPGDSTKYSTELHPLPANFFENGSMEQIRTFIRRETGVTLGKFYDEEKIKKLFVPAPITAPFASIHEDDFSTSIAYLQELFQTDMESWVYVDYVALDARNGKAYFVHSEVRHVGGAYGSEEFFHELTYDQVREKAKQHGKAGVYDRLSADTWREFISQAVWDKIAKQDAPRPAELTPAKPKGQPITEFYMELHNVHAHAHVWFRKTRHGYRVFYIRSHGWHYGLSFRFRPTEEMVSRVLAGEFGHRFEAYDRLLTHQEADAVIAQAQKTPEKPQPLPPYVSGYYINGAGRHAIDSSHWQHFGYNLEKVAEYGCIMKDPQEVSQ